MPMQPLNPGLYGTLKRIFGDVKVYSQGMPFQYHISIDPLTGRKKLNIDQRGEYYAVNCPYCVYACGRPDLKHRLWVCHKYGTYIEELGRYLWDLAICYNENCLIKPEFRDNFKELLAGTNTLRYEYDTLVTTVEPKEVTLPATTIPIVHLPETHPAIQYLRKRKYEPEYLYQLFKVGFCGELDINYPRAYNRIIIPVYVRGKLLGWQARAIDNSDLKYYTEKGTQLSKALYGYDLLPEQIRTVILVEGAFDVWRLGPGALALFGLNINNEKIKLLLDKNVKEVILLLDGDVYTRHQDKLDRLRNVLSMHFKVFDFQLPEHLDPADLDQEIANGIVCGIQNV